MHAPPAGLEQLAIDLHDLPGRQAYLDTVAAYVAANPDAEWITGGGWAMEYFPNGAPRREDLDAVTGNRPAFLFNRDVHGAWVNSAALERAGIDATGRRRAWQCDEDLRRNGQSSIPNARAGSTDERGVGAAGAGTSCFA